MSEVHWGLPVALYLFLAGMSAGGFLCTTLGARERGLPVETPERGMAFLVPFLLALGVLMLIGDLGQRAAFWKLLVSFSPASPMSLGAWVLVLFSLVAALQAILSLPERFGPVRSLPQWLSRARKLCGRRFRLWGSFLAVLVAVYTGVLLSSASVPLWNWMLGPLFLFSSLSTGTALGLLVGRSRARQEEQGEEKKRCRVFLFGQMLAVFLFLLVAGGTQPVQVLLHLVAGWTGVLWWLGAVGAGILLPLVISWRKVVPRWAVSAACLAELAGAFLLRWSLLIAGQA